MIRNKEQLARSINRLGTDSAFEVFAKAKKLEDTGRDIIHLGIGQPDFKTPKHIVEAACKALKDGHHGYTPAGGIPELREAVIENIRKYRKVRLDPNNVLISPGGKSVIFYSILLFGEKGSEIIYPDPGFLSYKSAISFTGAKPVPLKYSEENKFSFDPEELLSVITSKTRLIIINSPSNPTGGIINKDELAELVNILEKYPEIYILSDEIYSRMLFEKNKHISPLQYESIRDRVILLDGWSKTYAMTGWRIGYGVFPTKLYKHAEKLAINCHSCVSTASQYGALEALRGPQEAVDKMVKEFQTRRDYMVKSINEIKGFRCQNPGGAFYIFPNIKETGLKSKIIENRLLEELGIAVVSGPSFGDFGEGYIRVSYANNLTNLKEAINRLKNHLMTE
jgi:aspartate/methionine/tyrosine aminotransferase